VSIDQNIIVRGIVLFIIDFFFFFRSFMSLGALIAEIDITIMPIRRFQKLKLLQNQLQLAHVPADVEISHFPMESYVFM